MKNTSLASDFSLDSSKNEQTLFTNYFNNETKVANLDKDFDFESSYS